MSFLKTVSSFAKIIDLPVIFKYIMQALFYPRLQLKRTFLILHGFLELVFS